jgi:O-antigen/teichoic acid export membrane protein
MRVRTRDTTVLAAGSAVSGLLAYVFFAVSTRTLGPAAAAPISVLWTFWSFAAAAVTFPLQHWIARTVIAHGEGSVRRFLPRVAGFILGIAVLLAMLSWLARSPLFHRDDVAFPLLIAAVTIGASLVGVVRGSLSARTRFRSLAGTLVGENGLRCAGALGLTAAGWRGPTAYGLCLVAGSLVVLALPRALHFSEAAGASAAPSSPLRLLGGAAGGSLIGQAVLTGGPVVLALSGGTAAEVTAMFAGLALFRAPYTLSLGVVSQLTGRLTLLVVAGRRDVLRRLQLALFATTGLGTVAAAVLGAWAGPMLVRLVFGHQVQLARSAALPIAVGSALALANLVAVVAFMAHGRGGAAVRTWLAGAVGGAVTFTALAAQGPLLRTSWTFVGAEAAAFAAGMAAQNRSAASARGRSVST